MRRVKGKDVWIFSRSIVRAILPSVTGACGLAFLAGTAWALPPVPTQPSATCDHSAAGKCYVSDSTTLTTSSPGAHHFNVCRSNDILTSSGWGGCNHIIKDTNQQPLAVGASYSFSDHLPPHPLRRAYRFRACDANNACTTWSSPKYISRDEEPPLVPGPTTVAGCVYPPGALSGCWMPGNFTIKTTAPQDDGGSGVDPDGYWACRSNDTTGFGGCDVTLGSMPMNSLPEVSISGGHLPGPGKQRAYRFAAKDNAGNRWSPWNTPLYVRVDNKAPTVSADNADPTTWYVSRTAIVEASDITGGVSANSGLKSVRYRWNNSLPTDCSSGGNLTSNQAVLPAPVGDNTLHLCAVDWVGHTDHWSGQFRVAAQSLDLDPVEELSFTFGANPTGPNGYDPSVLLNAAGTAGRAFIQKAEVWGSPPNNHFHDAVVEYALNGTKVGSVTDGHAGWGCSPAQVNDANNGSGGVDAILDSNNAARTLAFYTRTPSDTFRGRAWLAYQESPGASWTHIDKALLHPLYNEPLCIAGPSGCDNQCHIKMGVARVAVREVGSHYYLYLEVRIDNSTHYPGVQLVGVFLMRVQKQTGSPYVQLAPGKAQLYRSTDDTWHNLPYDAATGYYADFANLPGGQTYSQWRILGAITQLGNVEVTPWGEYIITYKDAADVKYKIATAPDFNLSRVIKTGIMDLSAVNIQRPNGPLYPNLYRKPNTAEYILFFNDRVGASTDEVIQSARVLPATAQLLTPMPTKAVGGEFTVTGWAYDATGDADLTLKVDGEAVYYRSFAFWHDPAEPCVAAPKAGESACPRREFSAGLDTSQLANGPHTLTVTVTERDKEPRNVSMTFEVKN